MSVRILMNDGKIDGQEWHYFLAGGSKSLVKVLNKKTNIFSILA